MLQSLKDPVISRNWNWTYWVIISHSLWLLQIWRWLATWWLAQSILLEKPSPAEFQWSTMLQRQRYYETWLLGTMLILDVFGKTVTWCQVCDLTRSPGSRLGFCKPSLLLHRVWQQGDEDQWQMKKLKSRWQYLTGRWPASRAPQTHPTAPPSRFENSFELPIDPKQNLFKKILAQPCAGEAGLPVLSTPTKILFCDLTLAPGERAVAEYQETIPPSASPSYRGTSVKYSYKVTP